jgi:hypothetical protein
LPHDLIFQGLGSWLIWSTSRPIVNFWCNFLSERCRWRVVDYHELIENHPNSKFYL